MDDGIGGGSRGISTVAKIGLGLGAAAITLTAVLVTTTTATQAIRPSPPLRQPPHREPPKSRMFFCQGLWKTIDEHGTEVTLSLEKNSEDSYTFVITDGHADQCDEFGTPVPGVLTGTGEVTGSELLLSYETLVCETKWGESPSLGNRRSTHLEGDVLKTSFPSCYRQGSLSHAKALKPRNRSKSSRTSSILLRNIDSSGFRTTIKANLSR